MTSEQLGAVRSGTVTAAPDSGSTDEPVTPDTGAAEADIPVAEPTGPIQPSGGFSVARKGYDRDEVDSAMARVEQRIADLERTIDEQQERLVSALKRPMLHELDEADLLVVASEETTQLVRAAKARARSVEEAAAAEASAVRQSTQAEREEMLATATRTLDEAKSRAANLMREAEERAEATLAEAERRAGVLIADAEERATTMVADAEKRAATMVGDAEQQASTVVTDAEQQASTVVTAAENRYEEIRQAIASHREQLREELDDQRAELNQVIESLKVLRQEFATSFQQVTETMDQVRNLSGMLWRFGEPVQRAEGYVEQVFEQLGEASLPPRQSGDASAADASTADTADDAGSSREAVATDQDADGTASTDRTGEDIDEDEAR